mmetsp:Transcript_4644/g.15470  ORF Transcript_4644/g.15470 Transcript_4644/m.15470 type:complete len:465 (-) Transcript_4644:23-1417(-)
MRVTAMPPSATVLAASTSRASPPSGPPSLRPNERRAKEPVATVPRGAEPQVAVVEGRTKVLRWRELKLGPVGRGQESLDLRLVLLGQQRAGGVNQSAAWTDEPCGALQHVRLHGQQLFYGTRPAQPAGVWVAPPGADAGARRVDEYPVEGPLPSLEPLVLALLDDVRLHVVHPRLLAARRPALESRVIDVHRNQPPLVAHLRRERERLAACARAVVDDVLARLCAQQQRNQLRPLVLRVDNPLAQPGDRTQGNRSRGQPDAHRRIGRPLRREAGGADRGERLVPRRLERVYPQVQRGVQLQRAQLRIDAVAISGAKPLPRPARALEARGGVHLRTLERRRERREPPPLGGCRLLGQPHAAVAAVASPAVAQPQAREQARARGRRHARRPEPRIDPALPARDALQQRGDRGALLRPEASSTHPLRQQRVERRAALGLQLEQTERLGLRRRLRLRRQLQGLCHRQH